MNPPRALLWVASLFLVLATAPSSLSRPVEKDAEYWRNQAKVRATLITKDNFKQQNNPRIREEKSGLVPLPEPFVISTALNIDTGSSSNGGGGSGSRSGRSGFESKKTTPEEEKSILVEGIRLPDDESDRVTHRNGRFINNVFVPNGAKVPAETVVSSSDGNRQPKQLPRQAKMFKGRRRRPQQRRRNGFAERYGQRLNNDDDSLAVESSISRRRTVAQAVTEEDSGESRDYSYHAGQTNAGRPVYYVVEDDDELHSDRRLVLFKSSMPSS